MNTYIVGKNLSGAQLRTELIRCYRGRIPVGLDTETEGLDPRSQAPASGVGQIACWSLSTPVYKKVFLWAAELDEFKSWLESDAPKVGHNIYGFDYHMFCNHNIALSGIVGDTLRMSKLLYCSKMRSHGLKDLARNWLGIEQPKFNSLFMRPKHSVEFVQESRKYKGEKVSLKYRETTKKVGEHKRVPTLYATGERGKFGKALEYIPLSSIPEVYPDRLDTLYEYATLDAYITRMLYEKFAEKLGKVEWKVDK